MEKSITFKEGNVEINFSDLDQEYDCLVTVTEDEEHLSGYYLTEENLRSLKKHIDYMLKKI